VSGPDGRLNAIVAVARDVTESVEAARDARLLQEVAMAANRSESEQEAMRTALELVSAHTGWPVGHVYVPEPDLPGELGPADIWHVEEGPSRERFRGLQEATVPAPGRGLSARVLQSGRVEWIRDIQADPTSDGVAVAKSLGLRAALAFPLRQGDSTIAVMEFFSDRPEEPDGATVDLMDSVGAQLGEVLRRRRAERELRTSEERFRALAESANDAIITIDEKGRVVYCNESLERIFGYPCDEVIGTEAARLLSDRRPDAEAREPSAFLTVGGTGLSGHTVELVGRRRDGSEFPVELSLARWESDRGSFLTGILRDITGRKRVERSLEEKVEELARSNAELGLFTYIASHDLREPLRTVGSNVQLFERHLSEHIDSEARKQIDFARGGVRRMQILIDDLLLYSRVGTEGRALERVASREAAEEAVQALSAAVEESGARVRLGDLPDVLADRSQLVQLFQNLVSNAIKFRTDAPPRIDVSAAREGEDWVFAVADNGIGIEARYAEHVFTIFQRLHAAERYPGTGIGLAVCRRIVERHGGRIWVEAASGGGSVFRFTIPLRNPRGK
jgi:PAS domain S-box-containing protein